MLRQRIIPCLTIDKNLDCIKTTQFKERRYIGDILNTIMLFNEKNVDEIILLDIEATTKMYKPNFDLIEKLASVCRMPLCYGGGIKTYNDVIKILNLGVEKISLSSVIFDDFTLIKKISKKVGSQSVVVCLDIKKNQFTENFEIYVNNGNKIINENLDDVITKVQNEGAGEIILNSIDRDGTMKGFCTEIVEKYCSSIKIPHTIMGGAGSYDDIKNLFKNHKILGAACGSAFIYKGIHNAVLINYPDEINKKKIICEEI